MSKKLYEESNIQDIASAIREKNGTENQYTVAQMASAVRDITTQPTLQEKTIVRNGSYTPDEGFDGFSEVTVNVPSGGGSAVIQPLSVTQNGVYNPPSGVDGFGPVSVNVGGSYTYMAKAEWDALTKAQKQAYGLVLIGNANTMAGAYYVGHLLPDYALFNHEDNDAQIWLKVTSQTHGYVISDLDIGTSTERTYEFVMTMVTGSGYGIHMLSFGGSRSAGGSIYFDRTMLGWWAAGSDRFRVAVSTNIQNGEKFHAAVVVASTAEGMHFSLYFNGDLVGEKTVTNYSNSLPYSSDNFAILFDQSQGNDFYKGTFYKFAVTPEALNPPDFKLIGQV